MLYCCICGCSNTSYKNKHKNDGVKFYYFPRDNVHMPWLNDKREKWIKAVKKYTQHPNTWLPSKNTVICSAHFIGNRKTENPLHPSYIPTIFPSKKHSNQKLERFVRQQSPLCKVCALDDSTKQYNTRQQCRMQQAGSVKVDAFEDSCSKLSPEVLTDKLEQREPPTRSVGCQNILSENESSQHKLSKKRSNRKKRVIM